MKLTVLSLCLALLAFASCNKCDDDRGIPPLPGTWQEEEMQGQFAGTTYRITFGDDRTFRLRWTVFTDAIDLKNPCNNGGHKYIRGTYAVSGNSLTLTGKFTDSLFAGEVPDCAFGADFNEPHSISGRNGQLILDDELGDFHRVILNRE